MTRMVAKAGPSMGVSMSHFGWPRVELTGGFYTYKFHNNSYKLTPDHEIRHDSYLEEHRQSHTGA